MEPVIFGTLNDPLQDVTMNTIAICLVIKKKTKTEIKCFQPLQSKTKGQDAALRQQAARSSCQGAMHRGNLAPVHSQGAHQALPACAASPQGSSYALQFGNGLEPGFLWEQGK